MVPLMSLWMPILLSAVAVFIASSVIHMLLGYHKTDFGRVPDENATLNALRPLNIPPGEYMVPHATGGADMKDPVFLEKVKSGPNLLITVLPTGMPNMGPLLAQWFAYCVIVSLFAAYVASRTLAPATTYMTVFRVAGTVAFASYALALWSNTIWYRKSVSTTVKSTFDGLIYGLLTAAVFGWLWP